MIYIHCSTFLWKVYDKICFALSYELKQLGFENKIVRNMNNIERPEDLYILFGFHVIAKNPKEIARLRGKKLIIYNTEQMISGKWDYMIQPIKLSGAHIIEYSSRNVEYFIKHGLTKIYWIPLGYSSSFEYFKGVDLHKRHPKTLCFMGSMNDYRRKQVSRISGLVRLEQKVGFLSEYKKVISEYGTHINIHYYNPSILEFVRIIPLICNKCTVITERSTDKKLDDMLEGIVHFIDLNKPDREVKIEIEKILRNCPVSGIESYKKLKEKYKYKTAIRNSGLLNVLNDTSKIARYHITSFSVPSKKKVPDNTVNIINNIKFNKRAKKKTSKNNTKRSEQAVMGFL